MESAVSKVEKLSRQSPGQWKSQGMQIDALLGPVKGGHFAPPCPCEPGPKFPHAGSPAVILDSTRALRVSAKEPFDQADPGGKAILIPNHAWVAKGFLVKTHPILMI